MNVTIVGIRFLIYEIARTADHIIDPILVSLDPFSHGSGLSSAHFLFSCGKYWVDVDVQVRRSLFMNYPHADGPKVIGPLLNRYAALSSQLIRLEPLGASAMVRQELLSALVGTFSTGGSRRFVGMLESSECPVVISGLQFCNFIVRFLLLVVVYGAEVLVLGFTHRSTVCVHKLRRVMHLRAIDGCGRPFVVLLID